MTVQDEGGSTIEWTQRTPDVIGSGRWNDDWTWNDDVRWADAPIWTTVSTGDRTD